MRRLAALLLAASPCAFAADQPHALTADEIRSAVVGRSLAFPVNRNGIAATLVVEADGTGSALLRNLRMQSRAPTGHPLAWRINGENQLCTRIDAVQPREFCSHVRRNEDGSYSRFRGERVFSTFSTI